MTEMPAIDSKPLTLTDASDKGFSFGTPINIGRAEVVMVEGREVRIDLVVPAERVSRLHARVTPDIDGALVEDLGSSNGTFVNDQRVLKPTRLRHGDRVRFDTVEYRFADTRHVVKTASARPAEAEKGTVIRQAEPAKPPPPSVVVDEGGVKGGTRIIPRRGEGLPENWVPPKPGTVMIQPGELKEYESRRKASESYFQKLEDSARHPQLWLIAGGGKGQAYELTCDGNFNFWNIGREAERCDIVLDDDTVSGLHGKIIFRDAKWRVVDLQATNPILVNGERRNPAFLSSRDCIQIGRSQCVFVLPRKLLAKSENWLQWLRSLLSGRK